MTSRPLLAALSCKGNTHLIIGDNNPLAASRCTASLSAGAHPILVTETPPPTNLLPSIESQEIQWENSVFQEEMLFRLGRKEVNHTVDAVFFTARTPSTPAAVKTCLRHRIPVNVVDAPDLCTFSLLSVHADGPLQVGVSTGGHGCGLAVRVRRHVAAQLPRGFGLAVESGPGHPSLLTIATLSALRTADIVLADKLIPSAILGLIPRRTPLQIARKFPGHADAAQSELLDAALDAVSAGKTVVRLKQGDPFVYGRGGEEVSFFRHRGLAHRTRSSSAPPPANKADPPTTTPLLPLPNNNLPHGPPPHPGPHPRPPHSRLAPNTPAAVIERASCPDQRVIRCPLRHVPDALAHHAPRPPGLLVVGRACDALCDAVPDDGRLPWRVEDEGFRVLDDYDFLDYGRPAFVDDGEQGHDQRRDQRRDQRHDERHDDRHDDNPNPNSPVGSE
ncbi:Uroporphyrinogen-III C-methyltransferase [Ophiocordyceps camponoti-floridani]|uniref:precorrin-2 dehydrogenase n=1 Tax=Ophiocordyceps camponoti-floridani TaxID=2030778 RepID=A0A8H4QD67_9HYPO|nr:Uroporphyrinogen-III C-methyltransferase [Ophiocordyceps camponoti-floridani]